MESQVQDYVFRGTTFADFNFFDYTVETYEVRKEKRDDERMDEERAKFHNGGRLKNPRDDYMTNHPKVKSHVRVQRSEHHNYLPNVIGHWFPRRDREDEEELYYATILALLRPWRDLGELKDDGRSWKEAGLLFLETATQRQRDIIAGMQFYYDSKSAAQDCPHDDIGDGDEGYMDVDVDETIEKEAMEKTEVCLCS